MKKTTAYARKQRRRLDGYNALEFMNAIERCRPYTERPEVPTGLEPTQDAATKALVIVRTAFEALRTGATPPRNEEHFDLMAHALGVSCIRAGQIGGPEPESNPMLPPLIAGNNALRQVLNRRRRWGKWQVLPAEVDTLSEAVDLYETILLASSPQQMAHAVDLRMKALKGQTLETLEDHAQ